MPDSAASKLEWCSSQRTVNTKTTNAAPLSDDSDLSGFYDIFASICTLVLLLLWLTYLILRYYKFFQRIKRTATLPFTECVTATKPPSWKIVIYISNFNNYCYLYIDSVLHYPESVLKARLLLNYL